MFLKEEANEKKPFEYNVAKAFAINKMKREGGILWLN
jgi:hypothetical protein